jgi:hypothetical protein
VAKDEQSRIVLF